MTTRIVFISDTHNQMDQVDLPVGDILVHAGDALGHGNFIELARFNEHLRDLGYRHILYSPGNHDWPFQEEFSLAKATLANATTLLDESVVIDGFKFYCSPWQPYFGGWAFNLQRGDPLREKWKLIPEDTDVLVTHGPPYNILDTVRYGEHAGCWDLADRISVVKPKIHCAGHLHQGYGSLQKENTLFLNASICNESYQPVNKPFVVDVDENKNVSLVSS